MKRAIRVLISLSLVPAAFASELLVPSQYTTIQSAIDADDNNGMLVNGAAGTYLINEPPWVGSDWAPNYGSGGQLPQEQQEEAVRAGALWPY